MTKENQQTQGNGSLSQGGDPKVQGVGQAEAQADDDEISNLSDQRHARQSPDPTHPARKK